MSTKHCKTKIVLNKHSPKNEGNTLVALFIGLLIGLGIALSVALYLNFSQLPFLTKVVDHIVGSDRKNTKRENLTQGIDPLGGRSFSDKTNSSDKNEGAPVEKLNFYDNLTRQEPNIAQAKKEKTAPKKKEASTASSFSKKRNSSSSTSTESAAPLSYHVLIGSFHSAEEVDNARARLALAGILTYVHKEIDSETQSIVHKLCVGPFYAKQQAVDALEQLKARHLEGQIVAIPTS